MGFPPADGGSDGGSIEGSTVASQMDASDAQIGTSADVTASPDSGGGGTDAHQTPEAGAGEGGATCMDDVKDGDETGVDCGGSCPPCVAYNIAPPNTSATIKNACDPMGASDVSFICPRFMLFSEEMKQAATDDEATNGWPSGSFNYGVATLDGAACCSCYQIVYSAPQDAALMYPPPKPLIIQNFNQGGAPNAFDVFMGKGGEGANTTGCSALYTTYPSIGEPGGGGITASSIPACGMTASSLESPGCVSTLTSDCDMIEGMNAYVTTTTQTSCVEANSAASAYHENWNVKAQQVECPTALTEVTGCKPTPGTNPAPDPTVQTAAEASSWSSFSTTTMEDCCKPSCAWPGNVTISTQANWSAMYQCDDMGNPMTN
jgi:hypothetical protein